MLKKFFNISDLNREQLISIVSGATVRSDLNGRNIGLIFEKYSTRTRLSFQVAINKLGGNCLDIRFDELNISRSETFEDTFKAMSCYLDGIIYRTNSHEKLLKAYKFFNKPMINALSEKSHPCQIISDLFTLKKRFGHLDLSILWMGDMNNVCFSYVDAMNLLPEVKFIICSTKNIISSHNWTLPKNVELISSLDNFNFANINALMTDVFVSMNDKESDEKLSELSKYQVTSEILNKTGDDCVFMHCLPANVGLEVSQEVIESNKSIVWEQAKNRMFAQEQLLHLIFRD